eukprot:2243058-Amphidinium_carterae.1
MQAPIQSRRSLIDVKDLVKPLPLQNPNTEFVTWARRSTCMGSGTSSGSRCDNDQRRDQTSNESGSLVEAEALGEQMSRRARGLLREIIAPSRSTLPSLQAAVERLENLWGAIAPGGMKQPDFATNWQRTLDWHHWSPYCPRSWRSIANSIGHTSAVTICSMQKSWCMQKLGGSAKAVPRELSVLRLCQWM